MEFKTLKDRMNYYRSLTDYRIMPNCYTLVMLDGRSFSKLIKNIYNRPFDDDFIRIMNMTAEYLCKNIQGALFAYVQSDEISILLSNESDTFFGGRLNKMLPVIASMASGKFNQLKTIDALKNMISDSDIESITEDGIIKAINDAKLVEFDCKVWNVSTFNDVFSWFLYRQNDCIRNSKQQSAQTYLPHSMLLNKSTDEQIELLKKKNGIDWKTRYNDGEKYGRFIYKEIKSREIYVESLDKTILCERSEFISHNAFLLNDVNSKEKFTELIKRLKAIRDIKN